MLDIIIIIGEFFQSNLLTLEMRSRSPKKESDWPKITKGVEDGSEDTASVNQHIFGIKGRIG